jgi:uncharacterized membrane protein YeaQ/YmgE (transglycosylase-associated protein family)
MLVNALLWIVFGGIAGWLGSLIVGSGSTLGLWGNVLVGIAGAFVGGYIADRMGISETPGIERPTSWLGFISAVVGAVILLLILNMVF